MNSQQNPNIRIKKKKGWKDLAEYVKIWKIIEHKEKMRKEKLKRLTSFGHWDLCPQHQKPKGASFIHLIDNTLQWNLIFLMRFIEFENKSTINLLLWLIAPIPWFTPINQFLDFFFKMWEVNDAFLQSIIKSKSWPE